MAVDGETVVAGAPHDDIGANVDQGSAWNLLRASGARAAEPGAGRRVADAGVAGRSAKRVVSGEAEGQARAGDRRQAQPSGGITGRASGRLKLRYRAADGRRLHQGDRRAPDWERKVLIRRRLTGRQRALPTGIVEIDYAGNPRTQPDAVRLRAARGRSLLHRTRLELDGRRLTVAGTTLRRVGGVVRLRVTYTGGQWNGRARINNGRWTLTSQLPAAGHRPHAYLTAQSTGDRTTTTGPHRGEQLGKGL